MAEQHEDILIVAVLQNDKAPDWYVKPGIPVPTESRYANMIIQTQLIISIIKNNQDYLGKLEHVFVSQGMVDVALFPLKENEVVCVVMKKQAMNSPVMRNVSEFLRSLGY